MGLDVEAWSEEEREKVEEQLTLQIALNNLDPETVVNAVKRENKIEEANKEGHGGRPSKVEKHKNRILQVLEGSKDVDVPRETVVDEIQDRIEDAVQDLSHQTELQLRRSLEKELNIGFKQPFHSFKEENGDYEDLLMLKRGFE